MFGWMLMFWRSRRKRSPAIICFCKRRPLSGRLWVVRPTVISDQRCLLARQRKCCWWKRAWENRCLKEHDDLAGYTLWVTHVPGMSGPYYRGEYVARVKIHGELPRHRRVLTQAIGSRCLFVGGAFFLSCSDVREFFLAARTNAADRPVVGSISTQRASVFGSHLASFSTLHQQSHAVDNGWCRFSRYLWNAESSPSACIAGRDASTYEVARRNAGLLPTPIRLLIPWYHAGETGHGAFKIGEEMLPWKTLWL